MNPSDIPPKRQQTSVFTLQIAYRSGHIKALDGLRGVAILLVLFFHCSRFEFPPVRAIAAFGWTGVDLFFVLSGFLITGILIDTQSKPHFYRNFFVRRVLRIFPLYYLVLSFFFAVHYFTQWQPITYYANHQVYFWTYTQNMLFAFQGWPENARFLNHFWSLAIEEQFYLFWPFVIGVLTPRKAMLVCIGAIILSILLRNLHPHEHFAYTFTLARLDPLALGALVAFLVRRNPAWLNRWTLPLGGTALAALAGIYLFTKIPSVDNPYFIKIGYTLFAIVYAAVLVVCFDTKKLGSFLSRILQIFPLRFLGKYSYGIYVYHWIIYILAYHWLFEPFSFMGNFFFIPFVGIVIAVSIISYHVFEIQFLKFKRRFA